MQPAEKKIYALQVETGAEKQIALRLMEQDRGKAFEIIIPERTLFEKKGFGFKEVTRLMLAGYVFIRMQPSAYEHCYAVIRHTNGVHRIVGALDREDTQRLMVLANGGDPWGLSRGIIEDGELRITQGPLKGHEDWIISFDRHRRRAQVGIWIGTTPAQIGLGLAIDRY